MLLNFSFENFMSFRGKEVFSMVAEKDLRGHDDRLISAGKPRQRILPVCAVFGGNAFGKTNFTRALRFIQRMALEQQNPGALIPFEAFFLDPMTRKSPASFDLNIFSEGKEYLIFVKLDKAKIIEEKVSRVVKGSPEVMYHRKKRLHVNKKFDANGKVKTALDTSGDNSLILSSRVLQTAKEFRPIHNWFADSLLILSADSKFTLHHNFDETLPQVGEALGLLDTGFKALKVIRIGVDEIPLPSELIDEIKKSVNSELTAYFLSPENDIYTVRVENDEIAAGLLCVVKNGWDSSEFNMRVKAESDGTQRLFSILPAILPLPQPGESKVLVIDELDRSLHSHIPLALLNYFLNSIDEKSRAQLIFTTHDTDLIDKGILRDDEIWVIEKSHDGVSEMRCLSEFEENRTGLTFHDLYMNGNLGGTPSVFLLSRKQLPAIGNSGRFDGKLEQKQL